MSFGNQPFYAQFIPPTIPYRNENDPYQNYGANTQSGNATQRWQGADNTGMREMSTQRRYLLATGRIDARAVPSAADNPANNPFNNGFFAKRSAGQSGGASGNTQLARTGAGFQATVDSQSGPRSVAVTPTLEQSMSARVPGWAQMAPDKRIASLQSFSGRYY